MFISVTDGDKPAATQLAASLHDLGFRVLATGGTAQAIRRMGVPVERILKITEGSPNVVERIEAGDVDLVINTPTGSGARADGWEIRRAAVGARHPVHHHDERRAAPPSARSARAARRAAGRARSRSSTARHGRGRARRQGDRRERREPPSRARSRRSGGGTAEVTATRGGRRLRPDLGARRATARAIRGPGSSTCWPPASGWGGGADERPYLPRAFSFARARAGAGGGASSSSCSRTIGPGTDRLGELEPGDGLWLARPARRSGSAPPRAAPAAAGRAAGSAWRRCCACARTRPGSDAPRCCSASASAAHAEAARAVPGADAAIVVTDDGSVGPPRPRHRAAARARSTATARPPSTPAARRRCSRRCARSAPSARCRPSWRSSPGMACGFGACFGCVVPTRDGYVRLCVDGPVLDAAALETGGAGAGRRGTGRATACDAPRRPLRRRARAVRS